MDLVNSVGQGQYQDGDGHRQFGRNGGHADAEFLGALGGQPKEGVEAHANEGERKDPRCLDAVVHGLYASREHPTESTCHEVVHRDGPGGSDAPALETRKEEENEHRAQDGGQKTQHVVS